MRCVVVVLGVCACARGGMGLQDAPPGGDDAPAHRDAAPDTTSADAACPRPAASGPHVLLSEVVLTPSGHEFIELVNPTTSTVDLSHYYLSDSGAYYKLPAGAPNLGADDFIVKFPAGTTLAPAQVITVATDTAANFMTAYGSQPSYSIADGTITTVAINPPATLTDAGELVVLFEWDGTSALVQDVDMVLAGVPSSINGLDPKGGYAQLGCTYAVDADSLPAQAAAAGAGKSTKRIALEGASETHGGNGNGITGDDETSEATGTTWDTTATFSAPTPGSVPAAIQ
ncbi:MAG: lamin tail domain-containing protein [Acidobacteriota bacterium]